MSIILCFACNQAIYRLQQRPMAGHPVRVECVESLSPQQYPAPQNFEPMCCPRCGQFPFILHNTGLQMLTQEGKFIPEVFL